MPDRDLLVVTPTFHPEQVGTPHYVTDMVREFERMGERVRVITNQPYYPAFTRFPGYGRSRRSDSLDEIPIRRLPTIVPRAGSPMWRIISEVNLLLQFVWALVIRQADSSSRVIAVSPGVPFVILAGRLARRRGGRLVVVVHDIGFGLAATTGGWLGRSIARVIRWVETMALNRADAVTVLSQAMKAVLVDAGVTTPIEVVELWPTIQPVDDGPPAVPTAMYSGNLGRKQGLEQLLGVAELLAVSLPEARLVIRGDGPERAKLVRATTQRGLRNVRFEPFVPLPELASSLAAAHLHVVPQLASGAMYAVPSKVVNILAAGRPVVVTAPTGSPLADLADECPAVRVCQPGDAVALGETVSAVLTAAPQQRAMWRREAQAWASRRDRTCAIRRILALLGTL